MFTMKVDHEVELQLFQLHHVEELFHMVDSNRHYLRVWLPWVDEMTTSMHYHTLIPMWLQQFAEHNGMNLGVRYKGKLVGNIGLQHIDWFNRQTAIGYYLAENAQGNGIMTRAVQGVLNYAFFELGLHRVEVRCGEKNLKSRAIPERLGFTYEGCIRDGENLYGEYHHLLVYSMLAREWNEKSNRNWRM